MESKCWNELQEIGLIASKQLIPDFSNYLDKSNSNSDISPEMLQKKQIDNKELVEIAIPVLNELNNYISGIVNRYAIILKDSEGYIIHLIDKNQDYVSLGHRCFEINQESSIFYQALKEGKVVDTKGINGNDSDTGEIFYTGVAIFDANNIVNSYIAVLSLSGKLPAITQLVWMAARTIEARLLPEQIDKYNIRVLIEMHSPSVIITDLQGVIIDANQSFCDFMGLSRNDITGKSLSILPCFFIDDNSLLPFDNYEDRQKINQNANVDFLVVMKKVLIKRVNYDPLICFLLGDKIPFEKHSKNSNAFDRLVGTSESIKKVKNLAQKAAGSMFDVLIEGESGTGKELIAQAIHQASRPDKPFVAVNCGSIPKELLQSELFGYEGGAFTGAKKGGNIGKFELADKGTLFLDEIGEMPPDMQISLLRFLQDKIVTRVGGVQDKKVDIRIIAATNRDLFLESQRGNFREDLYYRLNVINIKVPPLRERKEDIPILTQYICKNICNEYNIINLELSKKFIECLSKYNWPGNVRELQNVIISSVVYADGSIVTVDCLPDHIKENRKTDLLRTSDNLDDNEKLVITKTLIKYNWNIAKSSRELGISRSTLYLKMQKYSINRETVPDFV